MPFQETLISYFKDQSKWTLTQLAYKIIVSSNIIQKLHSGSIKKFLLQIFLQKCCHHHQQQRMHIQKWQQHLVKTKIQEYIDYSYELTS